jgi:hypothetical protein
MHQSACLGNQNSKHRQGFLFGLANVVITFDTFRTQKERTRMTEATATRRVFAFNTSHALSACLTYIF